jgi:hypothetical protein
MSGRLCENALHLWRSDWLLKSLYPYAMRAYVAITPIELQDFFNSGSSTVDTALIVDQSNLEDHESNSETLEELEFESSWEAALQSRAKQGSPGALGLVLAVDLGAEQIGAIEGNQVGLLSNLSWSQVQSLLLAESDESELSWFAAQEIPTYLPQWLA